MKKRIFSFFAILALVVSSVGCSDNESETIGEENSIERFYPTEEQKPVEVADVSGRLEYDEESQKWMVSCLDFPLAGGDELGVVLIADKIPSELIDYSGDVCVKGSVVYLYTEVYMYNGNAMRSVAFYSLQVDEMEKVAKSRSGKSELMCQTQAIESPVCLSNLLSRTTGNNDCILNVFVHIC